MPILIVDDLPEFAALYQLMLKTAGYETHSVTDGESALKCAQRQQFDLILVDVVMPKIDGYDLCRRLTEQPWHQTPIVLMSATGDVEFADKARQVGAAGHLAKPFSLRQLLNCVETVLVTRQPGQPA